MASVFDHVLLTGGGGFIGSHLLAAIRGLHPESRVTVVDSFITGQRENIVRLRNDPQVKIIEHDLTDYRWLTDWVRTTDPFTLILHFASPASPPRYQAEPVLTYLVNSTTTHYLAKAAHDMGARMVFAGTSEAYGDPLEHPQKETYWGNVNPNGVRSCYDESKRLGETICGVWHREFGADIRILRIFNTYGPNMDPFDGRVIPEFCVRALRGEPVVFYGDGSQTRSFCYVEDLVNGILKYAETDGLDGETINLGNPNEFTMRELRDVLSEVMGKPIPEEFAPLPGDDPTRRQPDISKAKKLLDWEPSISLRQGLEPTLSYFRAVLEHETV